MLHLIRLPGENLRHLQQVGMSFHNNGVETTSGKSYEKSFPHRLSSPLLPRPLVNLDTFEDLASLNT